MRCMGGWVCGVVIGAAACSEPGGGADAADTSGDTFEVTTSAATEPGPVTASETEADATGPSTSGVDATTVAETEDVPPGCDPPNTVDIGGQCVPSCGVAGGNTCVDAASTLCEGLPPLQSHDCAVCCSRPEYPAATPASFHFTYQSSLNHWDSILGLTQTHPSVVLVGENQPPQVGVDRWSAYLSYRDEPQPTAQDINALLVDPATAPRFVMLEELHNEESEAFFVALADDMRIHYPQWAGRWGVFVGFGNYPVLADGLDAMLQAHAVIALELYPSKDEYCAAGGNGGERDIWLAEQFTGNASLGRLDWLLERKAMHGSQSFITPVFGVGDVLAGEENAAVFIDRMFYVWMTRTGQPSMISAANGGPGAYKWQDVAKTELGYGVGNTSRDLAWAESFEHYAVQGLASSRLGPVSCP